MADLATLGLVFETKGAEQAVRTLDQVAQKAGMAEGATENLSSAQMQGRKASDDLAGAAHRTAKATDTLAAATDGATVAQMRYNSAQTMAGKGARLASYEMVNLGRQLGDVATMAALGASPMMILSTQGLQIAEIFGVARQRGVGFAGALAQLAGAAGSLLIRFLPFAAVIGGAVGAFSMFQKAVDESTEGATTWGDTWQATINVVGSAIMDGPIGQGLQWLGRMFAATFQAIAGVVISATDHIVGRMGAAYQLITQNWRRLPQVFGVLGQSAANAFLDHIEDMINTAIRGVNMLLEKVGMATLGRIDIPEIRLANAQIAAEYDSLSQSISASFRAARLDFVDQVAREAERLAAAKDEAAGASQRQTAALRPETQAIDEQARAFADLLERLKTPAEKELERLTADMRTLRIELDEGRISLQQYRDLFDRLWTAQPQLVRAVTEEIITLSDEARQLPSALDQWREGLEEVESMTSAIRWAVDDVARAIENKDWGSVFAGLLRTLERVKDLWNSGQPGGRYSAAGSLFSAAGSAVGGTGGMVLGAVGSGFSAAGAAKAMAGTLGVFGDAIAGLAGPIGIAVGGLSLLTQVLKREPTNAGAGYDLITGQLSGNKRTQETESAVIGAAQAIKDIQAALKGAGVELTDSVRGLVIGTRDASTIYLTSGKELKSAVGDAGAAVETALRAMMESATYASEAQEKVAKAALAAGGGFEAVAQALDAYAAAQQISANLADEITRLTEPQLYEEQMVRRAIEEQRKAYEALTKDGYLTAEQLATINGQLATLEGLQLDEVMKRYTDAVNDNADAQRAAAEAARTMLEDAKAYSDRIFSVSRDVMSMDAEILKLQGDAAGALAIERQLQMERTDPLARGRLQDLWAAQDVSAARNALTQAVERERSSIEAARDKFQGLADSLSDFASEIARKAVDALGPMRTYEYARAEWSKALARGVTDQASLQAFLGAGNAFAAASQGSQSQIQYLRDLAAVRRATQNAEYFAREQVDVAVQQLEALNATVSGLLGVQQGVLSVEQAILNLAAAMTAQKAGAGAGAASFADAALTGMMSGSGGWYTQSPGGGWGGLLPGFDTLGGGYTLPNGQNSASYYGAGGTNPTGFLDLAANMIGFSTGGSFDIGGSSPTGDQLIVPIRGNSGEHVNVSKQDSMARLADAMERQNALLERLAKSSDENARAAKDTANTLNNAARGNQPLKTAAA